MQLIDETFSMLSSALSLRLQQLEGNVERILQLLNDYEAELMDEDDPGRRSKYRRRIEDLNRQRVSYEREFTELQAQLSSEQPFQIQTIANQLQQIDGKLDWLLDGQAVIYETVLSHFTANEQALLRPLTEQLDEHKINEMKAVLEAVDNNQISGEEVKQVIAETRQLLAVMTERNLALPSGNKAVLEMLNEPTIDAKYALKVSVPIIPFILSYECELGLGAAIKLKETWQHWKSKFCKG